MHASGFAGLSGCCQYRCPGLRQQRCRRLSLPGLERRLACILGVATLHVAAAANSTRCMLEYNDVKLLCGLGALLHHAAVLVVALCGGASITFAPAMSLHMHSASFTLAPAMSLQNITRLVSWVILLRMRVLFVCVWCWRQATVAPDASNYYYSFFCMAAAPTGVFAVVTVVCTDSFGMVCCMRCSC